MARLAKAGGEAWAWHNIEPLLDELGGGGSGPGIIKVSAHARHLGIVEAFVGAAASAGLVRRQGIRDKAQEEVAYPFYNIDTRGRRCSAATGFLKGARKRPNLSVETAVKVNRIVFDGGERMRCWPSVTDTGLASVRAGKSFSAPARSNHRRLALAHGTRVPCWTPRAWLWCASGMAWGETCASIFCSD